MAPMKDPNEKKLESSYVCILCQVSFGEKIQWQFPKRTKPVPVFVSMFLNGKTFIVEDDSCIQDNEAYFNFRFAGVI